MTMRNDIETECKSATPGQRRPDFACPDQNCGFLGQCRLAPVRGATWAQQAALTPDVTLTNEGDMAPVQARQPLTVQAFPGVGGRCVLIDGASYEVEGWPARQPLTDAELRAEFAKLYPQDDVTLTVSENNRDFAAAAIGARHHWRAFQYGARAIEAAHGIVPA